MGFLLNILYCQNTQNTQAYSTIYEYKGINYYKARIITFQLLTKYKKCACQFLNEYFYTIVYTNSQNDYI